MSAVRDPKLQFVKLHLFVSIVKALTDGYTSRRRKKTTMKKRCLLELMIVDYEEPIYKLNVRKCVLRRIIQKNSALSCKLRYAGSTWRYWRSYRYRFKQRRCYATECLFNGACCFPQATHPIELLLTRKKIFMIFRSHWRLMFPEYKEPAR